MTSHLYRKYGLEVHQKRCHHNLKKVIENDQDKIWWDFKQNTSLRSTNQTPLSTKKQENVYSLTLLFLVIKKLTRSRNTLTIESDCGSFRSLLFLWTLDYWITRVYTPNLKSYIEKIPATDRKAFRQYQDRSLY